MKDFMERDPDLFNFSPCLYIVLVGCIIAILILIYRVFFSL